MNILTYECTNTLKTLGRPVSCERDNGVWRNVETARCEDKTERRYAERNAAWEEKLLLCERSNEWKKSRQEKTKEFHIRNALMDLSKKRLMKCSEDG